jgi:hypothetical protein
MARFDISGWWSGEYSYDDALACIPASVKFSLTAHLGWFGRFRGVVVDDVITSGSPEASVNGHVTGRKVSFLKHYALSYAPHGGRWISLRDYLALEHGVILDDDVPPDPVKYQGEYDPSEDMVTGTWQIEEKVIPVRSKGKLLELVMPGVAGKWEMKRLPG